MLSGKFGIACVLFIVKIMLLHPLRMRYLNIDTAGAWICASAR